MIPAHRPLLLGTLLLGACAGMFIESPADCVALCATAHDCGFLPSALGYGDPAGDALADCERLCSQSPVDDPDTAAIAACLAATGEDGWCGDPDDEAYALGLQCAAASACLDQAFAGANVRGYADLEVALVTYSDFANHYSEDALRALYTAEDEPQTCAPALCAMEACPRTDDDEVACDPALCGKAMFQIGKTCDDLGATAIDLIANQRGAPMASQVVLDDSEGSSCMTSSVVFDSVYNLRPGPVRVSARIAGTHLAGELAGIGYPIPDGAEPDDLVDYCLRFPGMNVQARAGDSRAVVPIADLATIASYFPGGDGPRACNE